VLWHADRQTASQTSAFVISNGNAREQQLKAKVAYAHAFSRKIGEGKSGCSGRKRKPQTNYCLPMTAVEEQLQRQACHKIISPARPEKSNFVWQQKVNKYSAMQIL